MGNVFDHLDVVLAGDGHDFIHRRGIGAIMHHHHRLGPRRDAFFKIFRIEAEGFGIDFGKNHGSAEAHRRQTRGPVGDRGADDLVAVADAAAEHRGLKRRRAAAVGQRILGAVPLRELGFKLFGDVGAGHVAVAQHGEDRVFHRLVDDRPLEHVSDRSGDGFFAAENGQFAHDCCLLSWFFRDETLLVSLLRIRKSTD
ncbi:hypothetical protein SDC9_93259 [bioreactor metagenome]|uniref:Uncharacterized protein n=1 Tax=bioreactor metagenome TaxID=1076179 RepID=A0A645A018_9ZZZZ